MKKHNVLSSAAGLAAVVCLAACTPKATPPKAEAADNQTPAVAEEEPVLVRTDVPNKAFFKDLFIDSGIRINAFPTMPTTSYLGLSYEWMRIGKDTLPNQDLQREIICGSADDTNGRLLYPDGEPRFKVIYVNGGLSDGHGLTMEMQGRETYRKFFANGGSYTGSCAGGYLCTAGFDRYYQGPGYLGIWPGMADEAAITKIFPNYIIPEDSPLLKYYDFGGDFKVDSVKHWNGPFYAQWQDVPGTEVLARNEIPGRILDGHPSIIAWKKDAFTGRAVPCGGHPEQVVDGEKRDLMAAILRYAMDGVGCAKVKGQLHNGELRRMTKATEDNDPAFTKIGDRQCHHFVINVPKKARNIRVRLEALDNYRLSLRMAQGTFAFKEDAQYRVENHELVKELVFDELPAGVWYIGVQCEDTVNATETEGCDIYTNTGVLNGVPYTISAEWETADMGKAILSRGADVNEMIKLLAAPTARASFLDSAITKIVFVTGSASKEGRRIDAPESEEPIYASMTADGVVTISTPAPSIKAGKATSNLFAGFTKLTEIENLAALDMSGAISLMSFFKDCRSIEKLDISCLNTSKIVGMDNMLRYMPKLRELNIGTLRSIDKLTEKPSYFSCGTSDADDVRTCAASGELTIRCTKEAAQWLAGTTLRHMHKGNDTIEAVKIRFLDYLTGEEYFPEWPK